MSLDVCGGDAGALSRGRLWSACWAEAEAVQIVANKKMGRLENRNTILLLTSNLRSSHAGIHHRAAASQSRAALRRAGNVHGLSPRGICQGLAAFVPKVHRANTGWPSEAASDVIKLLSQPTNVIKLLSQTD